MSPNYSLLFLSVRLSLFGDFNGFPIVVTRKEHSCCWCGPLIESLHLAFSMVHKKDYSIFRSMRILHESFITIDKGLIEQLCSIECFFFLVSFCCVLLSNPLFFFFRFLFYLSFYNKK